MATSKPSQAESLDPERVAAFLRENPDFLDSRPALLAALDFSHETPAGVSSLIERQVSVLRTENQRYHERLQALQQSQEASRSLIERGHQLALDMLTAGSTATAIRDLFRFLQEHYTADSCHLFLFMATRPSTTIEQVHIRDHHDRLRLLLAELFNRKQPLLDSLQSEYLSLIFGECSESIHSTLLLPLTGVDWEGLFVIGSASRDRYRRGPELELLIFLARIAALRLDDWLKTDGS